jgi:tRNA(fMet)-specific endonuclease VapC
LKKPPLYVLDSGIVIHLIRDSALGQHVNAAYRLGALPHRPVVCIVTHGELLSFAEWRAWGAEKRRKLRELLDNLVTIDVSAQEVLAAYAELDVASLKHTGGARNMGKNDLWIAAVTRAVEGTLVTTDRDFDHLHPELIKREYIDPERFRGRQTS